MKTSIYSEFEQNLFKFESRKDGAVDGATYWRPSEEYQYSLEIFKPWGGLDPVLDWCKAQCSGTWCWKLLRASTDTQPGCYQFFFDNDKDRLAFALKWR